MAGKDALCSAEREQARLAAAPVFFALRAARRRGAASRPRAPEHVRERRRVLRSPRLCPARPSDSLSPALNRGVELTSCRLEGQQRSRVAAERGASPADSPQSRWNEAAVGEKPSRRQAQAAAEQRVGLHRPAGRPQHGAADSDRRSRLHRRTCMHGGRV